MVNKTTQTPAEQQNTVQGHKHWHESLRSFDRTSPAATDILARKIIREPGSIEEIVISSGLWGDTANLVVDVKKNNVTVLSAPVTILHTATDGSVVIAQPASDALASVDVGDILTIESGATMSSNGADLSVDCRIAKRFA